MDDIIKISNINDLYFAQFPFIFIIYMEIRKKLMFQSKYQLMGQIT